MDSLENELENLVEMTSESENVDNNNSSNVLDTKICKYILDDTSTDSENVNRTKTLAHQTTSNETLKNKILVFEPNSSIMEKFQNKLKQHLLKQRDLIKNELLSIVSVFFIYYLFIYYLFYTYI